ncbi:hypothetical protein GTS_06020 [Gandjariella thermophila]|uniref:Uncharacterized protein n=2 Tax=Gandjariella thermophila TaxID=1931992 RepID=A0A4D4J2X3_9PSEU|nr:hypothetical protein GTS_06020 [Gandjariella thermophila]
MLGGLIRALLPQPVRIVPQDCFWGGRWYREGDFFGGRRCFGGRWSGGMSR